MSVLDTVKSKPLFYGGAAIVVVIGVYYVLSTGGSQTVSSGGGSDPSSVAAAAAIQQAQLQANQANTQIAGAIQANQDTIGGQITLAQIDADSKNHIADLTASIAGQQINAYSQDSALNSTLVAQTEQKRIQSGTDQKQIDATTSITNSQTLANVLISNANTVAAQNIHIADVTAQTSQALINANAATNQAIIDNQCHGFSCLF